MQVHIGQQNKEQAKVVQPKQQVKVVVSTHPVRVREMLDKDGNVIDPRTKQIIKSVNEQNK